MSLRFRKTITLAPGLRLNLGTRGPSLSVGPRGASMTFGRRGVFGNVGLPGTGLSYRTRLDQPNGPMSNPNEQDQTPEVIPITATITEAGELILKDPDGAPLPKAAREAAISRNQAALTDLLVQRGTELNAWFDTLIRPHLRTLAPGSLSATFVPEPFELPRPEKPEKEAPGMLGSWFGGQERAEARYNEELADYRTALSEWHAAEENQRACQEAARSRHAKLLSGDPIAEQGRFEERLAAINWPRQTAVSYQVVGAELQASVDLPEIEDMPAETAKVHRDEMRINLDRKSEPKLRLDYATHVHSIAFRVAGEAFAAMPTILSVIICGFSQRQSRATGRLEDEYLYSVRIDRAGWERINFSMLDAIDPVDALARFDLRRDMTSTGLFRPIIPF